MMLQSGRVPGLTPALFLGVAVMAACSDSAMGPSAGDAVRFPTTVSKVVVPGVEVCEDISFNSLAHGTALTNQLSVFGSVLTFSGIRYDAGGPAGAADLRILDPFSPLGPDNDLRNTSVGAGECATCTSPMLVINDPVDGTAAAPSDNANGGEILITGFPAGTYIKSFSLADHEATEAAARLIVDGENIAPLVQPDGEHEVITLNTTSERLITGAGARFILGNPPTLGSEAIDNIRICKRTPSTGCTYTKGWYQNKNGAPTVIAVDGRTKAEAQAIFAATPGQPGDVTWGTDNKPNNLLNLYQQFLAALNNLGGDANEDAGPDAVDAAIDAVQAGTGGTGLHISTTLSETEISDLIDVLSAFNEGKYAGWPHCQVLTRL